MKTRINSPINSHRVTVSEAKYRKINFPGKREQQHTLTAAVFNVNVKANKPCKAGDVL